MATETLESLTCGQYQVYIGERAGGTLVCRIDGLAALSYNRTLNDHSECNLAIAINAHCASALRFVNPWQHEIRVFRNAVPVWVGPIISLKYQPSTSRITIYARDLWAWTDKRFIELVDVDYDVEDVDAKDVFEWVLAHGYNKQPWNMTWTLSPTLIPLTRLYPAYPIGDRWGGKYPICGAELRDIASYGVDFTVVNRHLYGGDLIVHPPSTSVLKISDQTWIKAPDILINGAQMSTRTAVAGGVGGYYGFYDDQMWIQTTSDSPYGLLETFTTKSELDDEDTTVLPNAITQEAVGRHILLSEPTAVITGGQLAGNAPFDFNNLIPGVPMSVGLLNSFRSLDTNYRLVSVNVQVNETSETIDLSLTLPGVSDIVGV